MKIKVEYESEILGKSVFWEGDSSRINEIRNIPARKTAEIVVLDGIGSARKCGMWTVSAEEDL